MSAALPVVVVEGDVARTVWRCSYCNEPADNMDHVEPVSREYASRRVAPKNRTVCVVACSECNGVLSDAPYYDVGARAGYLAGALAAYHSKLLNMPEWSSDELAELRGNLARAVRAAMRAKTVVLKRIEHCRFVEALSPTIEECWDAQDSGGWL